MCIIIIRIPWNYILNEVIDTVMLLLFSAGLYCFFVSFVWNVIAEDSQSRTCKLKAEMDENLEIMIRKENIRFFFFVPVDMCQHGLMLHIFQLYEGYFGMISALFCYFLSLLLFLLPSKFILFVFSCFQWDVLYYTFWTALMLSDSISKFIYTHEHIPFTFIYLKRSTHYFE